MRRARCTSAHAARRPLVDLVRRASRQRPDDQRDASASPSTPSTQGRARRSGTTASTRPASSARSALWDRSPTAAPTVASRPRGARRSRWWRPPRPPDRSQSDAVGGQHAAGGRRAGRRRSTAGRRRGGACSAAAVRPSWSSDTMPSCMRAPPERVMHTTGSFRSMARSERPHDLLAVDHTHRAAEEPEAVLDDHVVLGAPGADRFVGEVALATGTGGGIGHAAALDGGQLRCVAGERQRVGRPQVGVPLLDQRVQEHRDQRSRAATVALESC